MSMEKIDVYNTWDNIIGVEIPGRYDWIAYRLDQDTWQRYSRAGYPIANDEVCRRGNIYKVEFYDERWIKYKILSRRPDTDEWGRDS